MHRITLLLVLTIAVMYYYILEKQQFTVLPSVYSYPRNKLTLRYFYKPTCPYCTRMAPVVDAVANEMNITLEKIDTSVVSVPEIYSVPTIIAIFNGKTDQFVGYANYDLFKSWVVRAYKL